MHVVYHNFFYLVRVEKYSKGAYMYYFPYTCMPQLFLFIVTRDLHVHVYQLLNT